jgi:four helix bundle protein
VVQEKLVSWCHGVVVEEADVKIERFEDLDCWKEARDLVRQVYSLSAVQLMSKDYGLKDQMRRAAVSVMANIAEGFSTRSNQEFIRFLDFSTRSAVEVQSQLYVAHDLHYIDQKRFIVKLNHV